MKLLHDFFRLRLAGPRTASVRGAAVSPEFSVTVPAPLAEPASGGVERVTAAPVRREPASFLKAPRHRRLGSAR
ncbi:hypothetical protein ASG75_14590 [Rhodanobacter sp. Soil772]|uniref:hypothetical protein n=1 Tax=Rhodanobacter sp. Soil772 TaxID=1736406 RepID=UPI0006F91425|nr:hypothetical protein [Rhodanobacter sp. Soil772]KRE83585.1 hypothetical protein ASG75_14590 [Rhodanobacter sp. Soil772]